MISMRYAWNIAAGHGLVWNTSERIEGFTNPLWTLLMGVIHLIESDLRLTSLYVQIISALCLLGTIVITCRLASILDLHRSVIISAPIVVAFYYPLNYFSLMGMETGLLALLIVSALYLCINDHKKNRFTLWPWLALGVSVLVRLDMVVPFMAIAIAAWWLNPHFRRQQLLACAAVLMVVVGGQTILRIWYYGEWLPNTYYLKMGAVPLASRLVRGGWVTGRFLYNHLWPFYILIPLWLISHFRNRALTYESFHKFIRSPLLLLLAPVLGQLVYTVYVGGDVWEREIFANRFLVIIIPAFYILVTALAVSWLSRITWLNQGFTRHPAVTGFIMGALLIVQSNWHPGYEVIRNQALLRAPILMTDDSREYAALANYFNQHLPPDTTLAVDRAGILPYFMPTYRFFDVMGKTDGVVSRMPSNLLAGNSVWEIDSFIPGHTKWNADHTLNVLKPDILVLTIGSKTDYQYLVSRDYKPMNMETNAFEQVQHMIFQRKENH